MLLELGPVASEDAERWIRMVRRISAELRTNPGPLVGIATDDLLDAWSQLIDRWSTEGDVFRWTELVDDDQAEFLLHGLERCAHAPSIARLTTPDEVESNLRFTLHMVNALVSGLVASGRRCEHYRDEFGLQPADWQARS